MTCAEIQNRLLAADDLAEDALPAELAAHVASCPACEAMRWRLARLEHAVRALPDPAGGEDAKRAFLVQLKPRASLLSATESPLRLILRGGWRLSAAAAVVLLLLGGAVWIVVSHRGPGPGVAKVPVAPSTPATVPPTAVAASEPTVIDKLVDMNLDLADASSPAERNLIFAEQATPLKATLEQLPPDERELAGKLFENGKWLSLNSDALEEAERFDRVAGLLFDRLQFATPAGDARIVARLTRRYGLVAARIDAARARLANASNMGPEQKRRLERLIRRQTDLQQRLQDLMQRAPEMSKMEIRSELEMIANAPKRKHHNRE